MLERNCFIGLVWFGCFITTLRFQRKIFTSFLVWAATKFIDVVTNSLNTRRSMHLQRNPRIEGTIHKRKSRLLLTASKYAGIQHVEVRGYVHVIVNAMSRTADSHTSVICKLACIFSCRMCLPSSVNPLRKRVCTLAWRQLGPNFDY